MGGENPLESRALSWDRALRYQSRGLRRRAKWQDGEAADRVYAKAVRLIDRFIEGRGEKSTRW